MSVDATSRPEHKPAGWRMVLAVVLWVGGFFLPFFIPVVALLPLPLATKTALSGLLILGLPQLLTVIAIALVGKAGFQHLKVQLSGVAKKFGPAAHVGRRRYRIGLVMLFLPLAVALLEPYLALLVVHEHLPPHWLFGVVGDTLFLTSFLVLGGEFWDKVKALFIYEARAILPPLSRPGVAGAAAT